MGLDVEKGFNSLQTGKCIQSNPSLLPGLGGKHSVSIPFKRESVSKVHGKVDGIQGSIDSVSIPFKRESVSKANSKQLPKELGKMFQFPSNGKVYPKAISVMWKLRSTACFNSLQTGKCIQSAIKRSVGVYSFNCFNSLQTGKCIQRTVSETEGQNNESFNSLQTGKRIQSLKRVG